jgi:hypothetical protein
MSDPDQNINNETENQDTQSPTVMIIGDSLKCAHGIDTLDINEWNEHCSDPANGHTENGTTRCSICTSLIEFEGLPFQPITPKGKNIKLKCDECAGKLGITQPENVVITVLEKVELE